MMIDRNTIIDVQNRSASVVVYSIPEKNIRREFTPGELKKIPYSELESLTFQPGGKQLIQDYLLVRMPQATKDLNVVTEPEYYMQKTNIVHLLKNGSLDEFLDCLDFAPVGVLDLVKEVALELPLTDLNKIKVINDKLGFDVLAAVEFMKSTPAAERRPDSTQRRRREG